MASQASATASKADVARRFMQLREISPANSRCAECHAADTSWVVLDYGVLTCVHCAGCHRGLGTHISKCARLSTTISRRPSSIGSNRKATKKARSSTRARCRRQCAVHRQRAIARMSSAARGCALNTTSCASRRVSTDTRSRRTNRSADGSSSRKGSGLLSSWRRRFVRVRGGALLEWYSGEVSSASADGTDESVAMTLLKGTLLLANAALIVDPDEPQHLRIRNGARGTGGGPSLLQLRCPSYDTAEAWAWAIYQCSRRGDTV